MFKNLLPCQCSKDSWEMWLNNIKFQYISWSSLINHRKRRVPFKRPLLLLFFVSVSKAWSKYGVRSVAHACNHLAITWRGNVNEACRFVLQSKDSLEENLTKEDFALWPANIFCCFSDEKVLSLLWKCDVFPPDWNAKLLTSATPVTCKPQLSSLCLKTDYYKFFSATSPVVHCSGSVF